MANTLCVYTYHVTLVQESLHILQGHTHGHRRRAEEAAAGVQEVIQQLLDFLLKQLVLGIMNDIRYLSVE